MLILVNAIAHVVLLLVELPLLTLGQVTVMSSHVSLLLVLDVLLPILNPRGLARCQGTVLDTIRDPVLLIGLASICLLYTSRCV